MEKDKCQRPTKEVRELDGVMGQQLQESEVAVREGEERLGEVEGRLAEMERRLREGERMRRQAEEWGIWRRG